MTAHLTSWIAAHGVLAVFALMAVDAILPVGVLEYPFGRYVVLTAIASLAWCLALGIAGHALGSHWESLHQAFRYLDVAAVAVVAALLVVAMRPSRVAVP